MNKALSNYINNLIVRYANAYGNDYSNLPEASFDEDFNDFINEQIQLDHMIRYDEDLVNLISMNVLEELKKRKYETNSI